MELGNQSNSGTAGGGVEGELAITDDDDDAKEDEDEEEDEAMVARAYPLVWFKLLRANFLFSRDAVPK